MIEVYGKEFCSYCNRAKTLLEQRGLEYTYFDVEEDSKAHNEMLYRNPAAKTVPQIFVDQKLLGGFDELYAMLTKKE